MSCTIRKYVFGSYANNKNPWPSCSKHRYLNKLVSGQNVNCSVKYNTKFTAIFAEKKMCVALYAVSNEQSFNNTLTNDIISFEQLGPDHLVK